MYCIVRPMVLDNNVPCTYHCLHVLKMYHANSGVNRMYSQGRKLTTVKHKCYAKITMQYILKLKKKFNLRHGVKIVINGLSKKKKAP